MGRNPKGKDRFPLPPFFGALAKLDDFSESWHGKWLFFRCSIQFSNGWVVNFLLPRYFLEKHWSDFFNKKHQEQKELNNDGNIRANGLQEEFEPLYRNLAFRFIIGQYTVLVSDMYNYLVPETSTIHENG